MPKEGAIQSGKVVKVDSSNDSGNEGNHTAKGLEAGAAVGAAGGIAAATVNGGGKESSEARKIVEEHQASPRTAEGIKGDTMTPAVSHRNSTQAAPVGNGTNGIENGLENLALAAPPAAATAPGAPAGDIVFDHAPSKTEIAEARQSIEGQR